MLTQVSPVELNVRVRGQGTPILCLHGHPGSSGSLAVFTDFLSDRFQTIAPDLRGYGESPVRSNFEMLDHLDDLELLLNRLNIDRCLILGWSLGGILAMEFALRFPQRVMGLILVGTAAHPRSSHPPISQIDLLFTAIAGVLNACKPGWMWNIETFGKRSLFRYLIQQHTPATYRYIASNGIYAYRKTTPAARHALERAIATGYNRLEDLPQITCPCLVLAGEADRHITAASSHETAQRLPNSQWYCYDRTAHLFPWEIPDRVRQKIEQWLASHFM
jgi:pimeloyl-ACP methyl ester carboxylesterase